MFKVGQEVWCLLFGKGEVIHVRDYGDFPVEVKYPNGKICEYTERGELFKTSSRSLFFSKPKVQAAEEPPFISEIEEKTVIIKDAEGDFHVILVYYEGEKYIRSYNDIKYLKEDITIYSVDKVFKY